MTCQSRYAFQPVVKLDHKQPIGFQTEFVVFDTINTKHQIVDSDLNSLNYTVTLRRKFLIKQMEN